MKIAVIVITCLFYTEAIAQQFRVSLSEPRKTYPTSRTIQLEGGEYIDFEMKFKNGAAGHWNNRIKIKSITLARYDKDMNVIKETTLPGDDDKVYSNLLLMLKKIGDKIWFIYVEHANKDSVGSVMAMEVNPLTLTTSSPKVLAASSSMKLTLSLMTYFYGPRNVFLKESPDHKHILLFVGAGKEQFYLSCLDEQLNVVWERKESIPGITDANIQSAVIDNAGVVYLGYTNPGKEDEKDKGHIMIFPKEISPIHKSFTLTNARPKEVLLLLSKNGYSIHIAGTYFEQTKNLAGAFNGSITIPEFTLSTITKAPFTTAIVSSLQADGWGNPEVKEYGLYANFTPALMESAKGVLAMVGEFKQKIQSSPGSHLSGTITGSILNIHFGSDKTSFSRIPKIRVSAGSTIGSSYYSFFLHDKVIIFYNDKEENLNRKIELGPLRSDVYKNVVMVAAVIDSTGAVEREKIIDMQDENFMALIGSTTILSSSVVQLPVVKIRGLGGAGNESLIATITIE